MLRKDPLPDWEETETLFRAHFDSSNVQASASQKLLHLPTPRVLVVAVKVQSVGRAQTQAAGPVVKRISNATARAFSDETTLLGQVDAHHLEDGVGGILTDTPVAPAMAVVLVPTCVTSVQTSTVAVVLMVAQLVVLP